MNISNGDELQQQLEMQRKLQSLEELVKKYLSREGLSRYSAIKTVHPEQAMRVLGVMAQLIQSGRIKKQLHDEEFKDILRMMQQPRKDFTMKRV